MESVKIVSGREGKGRRGGKPTAATDPWLLESSRSRDGRSRRGTGEPLPARLHKTRTSKLCARVCVYVRVCVYICLDRQDTKKTEILGESPLS